MISAKVVSFKADESVIDDFFLKLDTGMEDVIDAILTRSQELVATSDGELKMSGHKESSFLDKSVVYDAPHAPFLEFGTSPHMPPYEPIEKWVHRNRANLGIKESEVPRAAEAIRWKIYKHGTEAQPFLRPAFDDVEARADEIIKKHFQ